MHRKCTFACTHLMCMYVSVTLIWCALTLWTSGDAYMYDTYQMHSWLHSTPALLYHMHLVCGCITIRPTIMGKFMYGFSVTLCRWSDWQITCPVFVHAGHWGSVWRHCFEAGRLQEAGWNLQAVCCPLHQHLNNQHRHGNLIPLSFRSTGKLLWAAPRWGTMDTEIKPLPLFPSSPRPPPPPHTPPAQRPPTLWWGPRATKCSLVPSLKPWSRSKYSLACCIHCQKAYFLNCYLCGSFCFIFPNSY